MIERPSRREGTTNTTFIYLLYICSMSVADNFSSGVTFIRDCCVCSPNSQEYALFRTGAVLMELQHNYISDYNDRLCRKIRTPIVATLDDLIRELHCVFESDSVNVDYVHQLMSNFKSNPADWKKFAKFDRYRYTRNLVDEGNGKFNLMILCWGEGHGSGIHDHANSHCFMKVMQGALSEVRFEFPKTEDSMTEVNEDEDEDEDDEDDRGLKEISRTTLELNQVCYINDSLGLHRIENPSNIDPAVSLHLYCPPFDTCHVFNQRTGQATPCKVTFWSKYGEKRNRSIQDSVAPEDK